MSDFGGLGRLGAQALVPVAKSGRASFETSRAAAMDRSLASLDFTPKGSTGDGYGSLAGVGFWLQIGGAVTSTIGTYYAAKNRQYDLKSQALAFEFEQSMAAINARQAEAAAQGILEAAAQASALVGLQYAQQRSSARTSQAARGVQIGVGSAAEEDASIRYAEQTDRLTIDANAVRDANAARLRATDMRNRGVMAGVSAGNARSSARSVNPLADAHGTFLGSAGMIAGQAAANRRYRT